MDVATQMKLFMEPRSIAIVGATMKTGVFSFNIAEQLVNHGFKGEIYPVNPKADHILGMRAYPSIGNVPEEVDLAIIPVWERSAVPKLVKECVEAGIKAIIVVTQGFADGDKKGKELQDRILRMAREGGARILGPNTLGVANAFIGLNTAFMPCRMERLPLGLICQSGVFFPGLRTIRTLGKGTDIANGCDIHLVEALAYYENDPETKVILLHIEGVRDGRQFMEIARRVSSKKPIIALKTGRSEKGARAAQSHTGSLAGKEEVFQAALRQCGIVHAGDMEELEDLAKAFLRLPLMRGRRVGIISMSGGAAVMLVDACAQYGLEVAELSPETQARLRELSPTWMKATNPLDYWPLNVHSGLGLAETTQVALKTFAADPNIDGIVLALGTIYLPESLRVAETVSELVETFSKPVCWWAGAASGERSIAELEKAGVTIFPSLERATRALGKLGDYWQFRQKL